jgi:hypothetical protein
VQTIPPVYVTDFMTGRKVRGFIPDPTQPGKYLCNFGDCRKPTGHRNYAVCWEHTSEAFRAHRVTTEHAETFDREFMAALKIADPPWVPARDVVTVEIAMQGAAVHKARELHAMRNRQPLMGERRASGCGELDLGEI